MSGALQVPRERPEDVPALDELRSLHSGGHRIEQLLPNILLKRAAVTYQGPSKSLGLLLILIGAVGFAAFLAMYSMGMSRTVLEIVLIGSAAIFDVGTVLFIWSEKRTPRGSEALIG